MQLAGVGVAINFELESIHFFVMDVAMNLLQPLFLRLSALRVQQLSPVIDALA